MPPTHVSLPGQTLPQLPQAFGFDVVSTQMPLHALWPAGHLQTPPVHVDPVAQALPQLPQWFVSVCSLTHADPHRASPGPHVLLHAPFEHT